MRSTTAYASAALKGDASTFSTNAREAYGKFGIDTSVHVWPESRVSLMRPFVVPTQIVPLATRDGAIVSSEPGRGAFGGGVAVSGRGVTPVGYVRSGLIRRQCAPPSVVAIRNW